MCYEIRLETLEKIRQEYNSRKYGMSKVFKEFIELLNAKNCIT
jgi:hypothetical protein